jgi:hypothetical protein
LNISLNSNSGLYFVKILTETGELITKKIIVN